MKREVIQDFLNLPGIAGVALLDGRSRPYFCGVDQSLNSQQKEALARGIHQVIDTTPPGFKFFEFQFSGHQAYIYRLEHGIILLVLATNSLVHASYVEVMNQLQQELQKDAASSIATFRLLADSSTLSKQDYWRRTQAQAVLTTPEEISAPIPLKPDVPSPAATTVLQSSSLPSVTLKETIAAMNQLSKFTMQYLGGTVVTNYWKATRPAMPWLQQFQVERSAQISFSASEGTSAQAAADKAVLTSEQQQWIQEWVEAFIQRCAKVIRDFPKTVREQALPEQQQFLLKNP
ncbi:hypothetical protein [Leptolyngbya ohadii]|uniref:hypothetical protein n=1 Tax=Leptolyngbya ohadii TaxID=1962290 RepID=UPI000B59CBC0|nr:hypothetical protein [Leptolyngbya ohadii]